MAIQDVAKVRLFPAVDVETVKSLPPLGKIREHLQAITLVEEDSTREFALQPPDCWQYVRVFAYVDTMELQIRVCSQRQVGRMTTVNADLKQSGPTRYGTPEPVSLWFQDGVRSTPDEILLANVIKEISLQRFSGRSDNTIQAFQSLKPGSRTL
jgi:hypothetical protein